MTTKGIESAVDSKDYADPAADLSLIAERGLPSRRIRPLTSGNLVVTLVGTKAGDAPRTLAVTANVDEDIQVTTVHAATNILFRVYW